MVAKAEEAMVEAVMVGEAGRRAGAMMGKAVALAAEMVAAARAAAAMGQAAAVPAVVARAVAERESVVPVAAVTGAVATAGEPMVAVV